MSDVVLWLGWAAGVAVTVALYPQVRRVAGAPVLLRPLLLVALGGAGFLATAIALVLVLVWTGVVLDLPTPSPSVLNGVLDLTFAAPLIGAAVAWEYGWVPLLVSLAAWLLIEVERTIAKPPAT
ncbi:MAG: hypothetical protein EXR66_00215 [Dehalococcoidia bacterium]|nr:hypothetical protein [Dehalococcoidia bacterium]